MASEIGGALANGEPAPPDVLLERVGRGDAEAFRRLYDLAAPKLFAVILRIVRDRGVAEDVLQEVFLRVWQKASIFSREKGGPMAWMTTLARNNAIDRLRSQRPARAVVAPRPGEEDPLAMIAADTGEPGDPLARRALAACLGELEAEARLAVVLAYVHGYSREEIGERLGRPVGTIKTWLHRSLKALGECMGT